MRLGSQPASGRPARIGHRHRRRPWQVPTTPPRYPDLFLQGFDLRPGCLDLLAQTGQQRPVLFPLGLADGFDQLLVQGPVAHNAKTNIGDLKMVCPNCHKMVHRLSASLSWEKVQQKLRIEENG